MKEFRKKEGISQMKLAEYLNASPTYIGEIEVGKKFPSIDMIERIAAILKIKPYHFFIDRTEQNTEIDTENSYPKLPRSMKKEIRRKLDFSIDELIREMLEEY
ncbi:MAG: helix-turn-helix transcriptional regulator [Treponema sp.]|jgi:transcriptional regulator with XRE-family HTH domain|nr:helix-turn-helix transcriptional regulator [Treponema sp.]